MEDGFAMPTSITRRPGPGMKNKEDSNTAISEEKTVEKNETQEVENPMKTSEDPPVKPKNPADKPKETADKPKDEGGETAVLNYKPPKWSGAPAFPYTLEVLKNGKMLDEVDKI